MQSADKLAKLAALARLVFEREALKLAKVDRQIADLRAGHAKEPALPTTEETGSILALSQGAKWQDWARVRRAEHLQDLARLQAERAPIAAGATRAFGRWQVLERLKDQA